MLIRRTVPEFTTASQLSLSTSPPHSYDQMASTFKVAKKAVTLPPTVRTLSSGVPHPTLVNLAAVGGGGHHGHGHSGPRSDVQPKWSGGISRTSSSLVSKTFVTCTKISTFFHRNAVSHHSTLQHPLAPSHNNGTSTPQPLLGMLPTFQTSPVTKLLPLLTIGLYNTSWLDLSVSFLLPSPNLPSPNSWEP